MKVLSFFNEQWEHDYLRQRLAGHDITFIEGTLQDHPDLRDEEVEVLSIFIKSPIDKEELDRFPNLKFIATRSTGFDHINLEEVKNRGIIVSNVPTYGENTVAEYAFALLLNLSRRVYESYDRVLKEGSFSTEGLRGFDLNGKTIGVVGSGHIGQYAIRMAKGFQMNVIAFDVRRDEALAEELGFQYVEFDELLAQSDVITLHAPYNEHTHHMINMDNVSKIKKGAYIINTARGGLIETRALIYALANDILAGAGLDVVEEEGYMRDDLELLMAPHPNPEDLQTLLSNQYLIDHPRVIIVPHNAFNTIEAIQRILDTTCSNVKAFADGQPQNVVNT
jgi:D-lactate dehydrogenase